MINSQNSFIIIKVYKRSYPNIISNFFNGRLPKEIYINVINQSEIKNAYEFNSTNNTIKMIYKSQLYSTKELFHDCISISEIDLSNFDASRVKDMGMMFSGCYNLNFLNLSNFDTSSVKNMHYMFSGCYNLNFLNLSNFNTSNAIYM